MSVFFTRRGKAAEQVNYAEWIKSDGNQYIILPYKPNQNTRIVCECQMTDTTGASFAFGARTGYGDRGFDAAVLASQVFYDYGNTYQFADRSNTTERIVIDANRAKATFTGATTTTIALTTANFSCLYDLALFALNQAGSVLTGENGFKGKVWSYWVYESDVLLYELRPCFDPDGVACLYDRVNRKYHYNQGTGEFVAGNGTDDSGDDVIQTIDFPT